MSDQWQPIATAPKDREIMLYEPIDGIYAMPPVIGMTYHRIYVGNWWKGDALNSPRWVQSLFRQPTHWMPLPDPPKEIP